MDSELIKKGVAVLGKLGLEGLRHGSPRREEEEKKIERDRREHQHREERSARESIGKPIS